MPGQLFLDAESVVVFMEAILLCVVLSYTIVKGVTELTRNGKRKQISKLSFRQEAMSADQKIRQFLCLKRPMDASGRYLVESLGSGGSGTNYHRPFHALRNDSDPLRAKG